MKKKLRNIVFISIVLSLVMGVSMVTVSLAGATGFDDVSSAEPIDPVVSEEVSSDYTSIPDEPISSEDVSSEIDYPSQDYESSSVPDYESSVYTPDPNWESSSSYYYYDPGDYYVESYDPENVVSSIENNVDMYKPRNDDDNDYKEEKWNKIVLNVDNNNKNGGSGSFSKIKDNTSKGDNGQWVLVVGIILIALSFIGIAYFIIATLHDKKKNKPKNGGSGGSGSSSSSRYSSDRSTGERTSHSYNASKKKPSRSNGDTEEIYLPRRSPTRYSGSHMK